MSTHQQPQADDIALVQRLNQSHTRLMAEVGKLIVGQNEALELVLIALLCRGHALLHGLPGLGKTKMANALAQSLGLQFRRIQFTPDLMPADITGTDILEEDPETGKRNRRFLEGPVFANLLLADEINRTPPKTQAALLEAMQEFQVSASGKTYQLPKPFMVLATQNPIELEGTYVLPEAQLDRFMFCITVKYPSFEDEKRIVKGTTGSAEPVLTPVVSREDVQHLQQLVRGVPISDDIVHYAVSLSANTRPQGSAVESVKRYVGTGASPRASQQLILGAKARALLNGRLHVDFADVEVLALPVIRHRVVMNFRSKADGVTSDQVIADILAQTPKEG